MAKKKAVTRTTKKATRKAAKKAKTSSPSPPAESNGGLIDFDEERLEHAKQCEAMVEDYRLAFEESKAKHAVAKAEYKLLIAKRNRVIAKTTDPKEVEDAQRHVDNAKNRMTKAKAAYGPPRRSTSRRRESCVTSMARYW